MNFVEVLESHDIQVVKGSKEGEVRINCLFCIERGETQDVRFRLGINYVTGTAHCFNCDWASSDKGPSLILKRIGEEAEVEASVAVESKEEVQVELPEGFEYISTQEDIWYHKKALKYLYNRNILPWQIKAKKLGVTICGKFAYRIIFPVVMNKALVGLVGRDFTVSSELKYLNSVGPKYLWNCPQDRSIEEIVLSEGIFKALKIERVAIKNDWLLPSISLLGHNLTSLHLEQLQYYKKLKKVIVWPDPDRVGIKGAIDISDKLEANGYRVYSIYPIPKVQADEMLDSSVQRMLETRIRYSEAVRSKMRAYAAFL